MAFIAPEQLPIGQYHSGAPEWLSKTSIRDFISHGPKWWQLAYLRKSIERTTPDGALQGLALDCYLTEGPITFAKRFPLLPEDAPKRPSKTQLNAKKPSPDTVAAIQWWQEWDAAHPDAEYLNANDRAILADAVDAVRKCCVWSDLEKALPQRTIRRQSESLGLGLQSRPDWLREDGAVLWDLKKTRDLDRFGAQAFDLGYHLQAAIGGWCLAGDGIALEHAYLVAVEWERGSRCRVLEIPHEMLAHGDHQMREAAAEIARRIKANDWSDDQKEPQMLQVPVWAQRKMEADHG